MMTSGKLPLLARLRSAEMLQRGSKAYDLVAAAPLILWFGVSGTGCLAYLHERLAQLFVRPNPTLCIEILARSGVLLFALVAITMLVVRRPPKAGARGIGPRIAGLLGTYLSIGILLLPPAPLTPIWLGISAFLMLAGGLRSPVTRSSIWAARSV